MFGDFGGWGDDFDWGCGWLVGSVVPGRNGREGDDRFLRNRMSGKGNEGRTLVFALHEMIDDILSSEPFVEKREIQRKGARARALKAVGGNGDLVMPAYRKQIKQDQEATSCVGGVRWKRLER